MIADEATMSLWLFRLPIANYVVFESWDFQTSQKCTAPDSEYCECVWVCMLFMLLLPLFVLYVFVQRLQNTSMVIVYVLANGKYIGVVQPINTRCHSLLIAKLIVMIIIINIIFVSEWHFQCLKVLWTSQDKKCQAKVEDRTNENGIMR